MQNQAIEFYKKQIEYGELIVKYSNSPEVTNYGLAYKEMSEQALNEFIIEMKKEISTVQSKGSLIEKAISLSIIRHARGFFKKLFMEV
jgi:hypothetical protein